MFPTTYSINFYTIIGPLVLLAIALIVLSAFLRKSRKGSAQYLTWTATMTGFICCIIMFASFFSNDAYFEVFQVAYSFYGIYMASTFLSTLIPLHKMIKQKEEESFHMSNSSSTVAVISTGYLFAFLIIAVGVACSVVNVYGTWGYHLVGSWTVRYFVKVWLLILVWPLILVNLILIRLVSQSLLHATRKAFILFNILTVVAAFTQTLTWYTGSYDWCAYLTLVFTDLPNVVAISIWFFYCDISTSFEPVDVDFNHFSVQYVE